MFLVHNVNIIIVKDKNEEKSVQEELAEDMLSLLASFSVKLYGMHSRKNVKKKVS
jgi:predicted site-specific integrase-resolvase